MSSIIPFPCARQQGLGTSFFGLLKKTGFLTLGLFFAALSISLLFKGFLFFSGDHATLTKVLWCHACSLQSMKGFRLLLNEIDFFLLSCISAAGGVGSCFSPWLWCASSRLVSTPLSVNGWWYSYYASMGEYICIMCKRVKTSVLCVKTN